MSLKRILSLHDFDPAARRRLPWAVYGFVSGGSEDSRSVRANRRSFEETALRPRVLVDVSKRSQSTTLFGRRYASPIGIAPMGAAALCRVEADLVLARAACAEEVPFILSGASSVALEKVIEQAPGTWFQAYVPANRPLIERLFERLRNAGYEVCVLTVDVPVPSNREHNLRNGFSLPLRPSLRLALDGLAHPRWLAGTLAVTLLRSGLPHFENFTAERGGPIIGGMGRTRRDAMSWADIAWMRGLWKGRLVVKGILNPEDARRAEAEGVDGIIVSNHGGRQLDGAAAPLRVLPEIVAAAGDLTVMMDGGVRRGTDVLAALALGAKFVFLGRPMLYAASVAGETGVRHALRLLREEIDRDMALLGCADLAAVTANLLDR